MQSACWVGLTFHVHLPLQSRAFDARSAPDETRKKSTAGEIGYKRRRPPRRLGGLRRPHRPGPHSACCSVQNTASQAKPSGRASRLRGVARWSIALPPVGNRWTNAERARERALERWPPGARLPHDASPQATVAVRDERACRRPRGPRLAQPQPCRGCHGCAAARAVVLHVEPCVVAAWRVHALEPLPFRAAARARLDRLRTLGDV